ncbi:MAG: cellulase family glycosylhydrolase [Sedimentisphaerales bacterium]|nr:cellulase family glycosylhydrolase [Sedimentisphaerales bacterium]
MNMARINRRDFLKAAGAGAAGLAITGRGVSSEEKPGPAQTAIPRWRGFNLLDYFNPRSMRPNSRNRTTEDDFRWMSDWGFDFVRLPMAYPQWIDFDRSRDIRPDDMTRIDESALEYIDGLVEMAGKYGLHVSLNMHRAPGYCVNAGFNEPFNLWKDQEALDAFCFQWGMWAKRYEGLPPARISFDLVNEPSMREDMNDQHSRRSPVPGDVYRRVAQAAAKAIRQANPNHLVIADGNNVGNDVIPEIVDLNIAQSCRGYVPGYISHYKAPWAFADVENLPAPVWPGTMGNEYWDRARLEKYYEPWIALARKGVGVHCGECGCWTRTPHEVFLAWFGDLLDILTDAGIGYALWNFRGDFGILDSNRADVTYEDFHGHKLDRKMLALLQKH